MPDYPPQHPVEPPTMRSSAHLNAALASSATAAAVISLLFGALLVLTEPEPVPVDQMPYAMGNLILFSGYAFGFAFVAFLVGTLLLGRLAENVLQQIHCNNPLGAAILGLLLSGGATLLIVGVMFWAAGAGSWTELAELIAGPSLAGAVAGPVYHRLSRSCGTLPTPPPAPPS